MPGCTAHSRAVDIENVECSAGQQANRGPRCWPPCGPEENVLMARASLPLRMTTSEAAR